MESKKSPKLQNRAVYILKNFYFQLRIKIFSFLRGKKKSENFSHNSELQNKFDKKLVRSLSKSRIPSLRQIKYAGKVMSKKELLLMRISFFTLALTSVIWVTVFYFQHLEITPVQGGEYKEAMLGAPKYINPLYSSLSDVDSDLSFLLFSSLYERGPSGELKPDLVERVDVSEDKKNYTLKITDQALWHDDELLTASDVVFTFDAIKNSVYKSTLKASFEGVEIERLGDYEVRFILNEPYAAFLDLLTFGILPAHLWSQIPPDSAQLAELNLKPIGSGPFRFDSLAKDKNGVIKEYALLANENYYNKTPLIDLRLFFYASINEAIDALNNQVVDGISYLPFREKDLILTPNSYVFEKLSLPQLTLIFLNQKQNPVLGDKALRQALAFAIDRNEIVNEVLGGNAYLSEGPILSNNFAYYHDIKKYDFNQEEAGKLLESLDWKLEEISEEQVVQAENDLEEEDKKAEAEEIIFMGPGKWRKKDGDFLIINLKTVERGENLAILEKIKAYWEEMGIKTIVEAVDVTDVQNEVIRPRNFDAFFYGQILGADPDPYAFWHSSQTGENGYNIAGFANKEVDALLEDARLNSDIAVRQEKYQEFQKIITEEVPAIFMYSPVYNYIHFNRLKGFSVTNIILPHNRFANIGDWYLKTGRRFVWE